MSQQMKELTRRYFGALLSEGKLSVADEILAPDVVVYPPTYWGEPLRGRESVKQFYGYLRAAFPDMHFTPGNEVIEGDQVATVFRLRGTHRGEYMGIAPTNKAMDLPGMDLFRVSAGKIQEIRIFYDTLGLMQQLGVAPMPEGARAP